MTVKVLKSHIGSSPFAAEVEDYRQRLLAHRFTVDVPAPMAASAMVEECIKRVQYPIEDQKPDDFVADYEIVDDLPSLDTRKAELLGLALLTFAKRRVELRAAGAGAEVLAALASHVEATEDQIAMLTDETIVSWAIPPYL